MLWKLPEIAVPPDALFWIGPFPVYNTFIITIVTVLIIVGIFRAALRNPAIIPGFLQNLVEWASQLLLNLCVDVAGKTKGRRFFPWVATIFFYVLIANWWEVIPGVETIGTLKAGAQPVAGFLLFGSHSNEIYPWIRPPSTDVNFTIALAVTSVVVTQIYGFRILGVRHQLARYFSLKEGPLGLIVGVLEAILELARIISFSFRLFGNLFAGDVLLLVIAFLIPFVGAIPFYALEVFVGFIQAFVFAFLTLVFLELGTSLHGAAEPEEEHAAEVARHERELVERGLAHTAQ